MRQNFARVNAIGAGYYARISIFHVRRVSKRRGAKRLPTTEVQARLNLKNSERKLADMIHLNFTPDDDEVSLDYMNGCMPGSYKEAADGMRRFLRKLKREWAKITGREKSEFKYIVVTECSKKGRYHHHCIFTGGMTARQIHAIWERGRVTTDPLQFAENGLRGLSHYIIKQRLGYRRWMASRNLRKPKPRQSDYRLTLRELRYINEHPEDVGYIEERFPGWKVSPNGVFCEKIASEIRGEGERTEGMPFCEVFLYREECPYYKRLPNGGIRFRFGEHFEIPDYGFPERGGEVWETDFTGVGSA